MATSAAGQMKAKAKTEANKCAPEQVLGARGTCCKNPEITFIGLGSAASAGYLFEYI